MTMIKARSEWPRSATLRDHAEAGFGLAPTRRASWRATSVVADIGRGWVIKYFFDRRSRPAGVVVVASALQPG